MSATLDSKPKVRRKAPEVAYPSVVASHYMRMKLKSYKYTKYDHAVLRHVWTLDKEHEALLDTQENYFCDLNFFISQINVEEYPRTYEDTFVWDEMNYYVIYLFSSGSYLDDLVADRPDYPMAFQLRYNRFNRFRVCLVRPWDKQWDKEYLLAQGYKDAMHGTPKVE